MTIPLFFPPVTYVQRLSLRAPSTIRQLCEIAGVECRASGAWTERQVEIVGGKELKITAEPGDWGKVMIEFGPMKLATKVGRQGAQIALAVLAYGMHDLAAKQSVIASSWTRIVSPKGRPKSDRALSGRERQRRFRARIRSATPA